MSEKLNVEASLELTAAQVEEKLSRLMNSPGGLQKIAQQINNAILKFSFILKSPSCDNVCLSQ